MRAVPIVFLLAGCVADPVSQIDLEIPAKEFSIDADRWQLDSARLPDYFATTCETTPVCAQAAKLACNGHCTGVCDPATSRCALDLDVSLYSAIDLVQEAPELRSLPEQSVISVQVDAVEFAVTRSSLSITTPELVVYVAPASVTDPDDPAATAIGTVPSVAAGTSLAGSELALTDDGRAELSRVMSTYKTPFNLLVAAKLGVVSSSELPTGRLDAVVKIRAHAGL